mgnify:CR=1 FL=1
MRGYDVHRVSCWPVAPYLAYVRRAWRGGHVRMRLRLQAKPGSVVAHFHHLVCMCATWDASDFEFLLS